jgi:hypothetical protein
VILPVFFWTGCDHDVPGNLPPIQPAAELPVFTEQQNEIEIADSFKSTDPTMVLGSIVDRANGQVHSFDNFLKADARTETTPAPEVLFKDFVENTVAANAAWLDFVKGEVSDTTRAEVMVTEVSVTSVGVSSMDQAKLQAFAQQVNANERDNYGVVIGYRDFVVSASLFKEQKIGGELSGYGAKIGGRWFGKHEAMRTDHRIIAVWSPLPFVLQQVGSQDRTIRAASFTALTRKAIDQSELRIKPLVAPRSFKVRSTR